MNEHRKNPGWCCTASFAVALMALAGCGPTEPTYIRVNLVGYLEDDSKVAIAFSHAAIRDEFEVVDAASGEVVMEGSTVPSDAPGWGAFEHYVQMDFSSLAQSGRFLVRIGAFESDEFGIGREAYGDAHEDLLAFMRQQRCGYNPFLDMYCHQEDARTFYGPMPDSTRIDATGGWHDAGDQLKYLITGSNATARMMLAYELAGDRFGDSFDATGRSGSNGLPDVLDEARWGLDWMHRLHPAPGQLFHQVADDRDHIGWKWPDKDSSDYGWGPMSYRAVYFANGEPQGLSEYKSTSTGVANLAGRYAAGMAKAYRLWRDRDPVFAAKSLAAAQDVYAMGRAKEGFQQGNSYGAPYRYTEDTWADDMEWGAAELYAVTGESQYLTEAKRYARMAATTSWLPNDTTDHYQYYPFVNVGHFALHPHVDEAFQDTLAGYYAAGIEAAVERARRNPYGIGVPFIWCSNNLAAALITQILLYERMTGDMQYHDFMLKQRDWLLGRNPWGTSMFTGIPADGEYPLDVHTSVYVLTEKVVPGGLVDGPVYGTIYRQLAGLQLTEPDEFAHLQNPFVVYHDDIGDYSTNEPTMDGTAGAIFLMAYFGMSAQ